MQSSVDKLEAYARQVFDGAQTLTTYCRMHRVEPFPLAEASSDILLSEPQDFLQQLVTQNQYLACLHWLGEFQVLACIPLSDSVPSPDVAELAGIPESHLRRVVRMMAATGFLREPEPGHVAHSALSASFVTRPSYLDAAMFLAETAAPAALQMPATSRHPVSTPLAMTTAHAQVPKLQRQWSAYLQYGLGHTDGNILEPLDQFDWLGLGGGAVVT
ncbi:hypothetical protein AbraIFM66950_001334, partial [Aspergillus brasiliensis]